VGRVYDTTRKTGENMTPTEEDIKKAELARLGEAAEKILGGKPWFKIILSVDGYVVESFGIPVEVMPLMFITLARSISNESTKVVRVDKEKIN